MSHNNNLASLLNKNIILIRMGGEMGIKSRQTRRRMLKNLHNNIKKLLEKYPSIKIINFRNRIIVHSEFKYDHNELVQLITSSISGISSASSALVVEAIEERIISEGLFEARKYIKPNSSFAVRAKREGSHSFSSIEIARNLGAAILNSQIENIKVDLDEPDYQIYLDIRGPLAFIYNKISRGIDGIPSLSQGKALALIKPNYNSLLSAWLMKKRGVKIIPIFFKTGKQNEKDYLTFLEFLFGEDFQIINLQDRLRHFKENSSLCLLCQLYCEKFTEETSRDLDYFTIISSTTFNYNNETTSLEALEVLKKKNSLAVLRPIQLGFYGNTLNRENIDSNPCCPYKSQVAIQITKDFNKTCVKEFLEFNTID